MIRPIALSLTLTLMLAVPATSRADTGEEALAAIPAEAIAFVCVPSIKSIDSDLRQAVVNLELQPFVQLPSNSLISLLKQQMPAFEGLNEEGSFAFVVMPAETWPELSMKLAMMIAAKDPKAMIEAMEGTAQENGLWSVSMFGEPGHAAVRGKHVVLAKFPEVVQAIKDSKGGMGKKLKPAERRTLEGLDAAMWMDGDRLFTLLKPMIQMMILPMMSAAQSSGTEMDVKSMEMNKKNMEMFFNGASSMTFGVGLDRGGLAMRGSLHCKPGSELAKRTKLATTTDSLLEGLPHGKYVLAFGQESDKAQMEASLEGIQEFLVLAQSAKDVDAEKAARLKSRVEEWLMLTRGGRGVVEPLKPGPDGLIGLSMIIDTTDGRKWTGQIDETLSMFKDLVSAAAKEQAEGDTGTATDVQVVLDAISYAADAEEVAGAKVSHLKFDLAKIEDLDEDEVEDALKVIGREGLLLRLASLPSNQVVVTFGGGKERLGQLMKHAGKKDAPLAADKSIAKVKDRLPKKRNAVYYLAADHGFALAQNILEALEEERLPVEMPMIDAPLAMSQTGGDGWLRIDLFLPTELIAAAKNVGMAMMGQEAEAPAQAAAP